MRPGSSPEPEGLPAQLRPNDREIACVAIGPRPGATPGLHLKRILVPIDFSPCSTKAVQYGVAFARQSGARLCLLYVGLGYYPLPAIGPLDVGSAEAHAHGQAAGRLAQLATDQIADEIPVDILVRSGCVPEEIVGAAQELRADVIILSTHGYTGLKHGWFGSVAEKVVRHAPCPVLVVREQEHEFLCDQCDGQNASTPQATRGG